MKKVLLMALSSLLFLLTANEYRVQDMNISNTQIVEQRISELNSKLRKKQREREKKASLREVRLKKLDDELKEKARLREISDSGHNAEEIAKALEK